jgi:hypothetical protein
MSATTVSLKLGDKERSLTWDNSALFRADEIGLPEKLARGQFGYSTLCKMIWVMLSESDRRMYPTAESVALAVPIKSASDVWVTVMKAYYAGEGLEEPARGKGKGGK